MLLPAMFRADKVHQLMSSLTFDEHTPFNIHDCAVMMLPVFLQGNGLFMMVLISLGNCSCCDS